MLYSKALPFALLSYRDAVSSTTSVSVTKLKREFGFTMSSASLCVAWGQEGHLCAVGGGCTEGTLHPWEQHRALP